MKREEMYLEIAEAISGIGEEIKRSYNPSQRYLPGSVDLAEILRPIVDQLNKALDLAEPSPDLLEKFNPIYNDAMTRLRQTWRSNDIRKGLISLFDTIIPGIAKDIQDFASGINKPG